MTVVLDTIAANRSAEAALPALPTLAGRDREGLAHAMAEIGVPEKQQRMRVEQLWGWLYAHGVTNFDAMTWYTICVMGNAPDELWMVPPL